MGWREDTVRHRRKPGGGYQLSPGYGESNRSMTFMAVPPERDPTSAETR